MIKFLRSTKVNKKKLNEMVKNALPFLFSGVVVGALVYGNYLKENTEVIYRKNVDRVHTNIVLSKKDMGITLKHVMDFPYLQKDTEYFKTSLVFNAMPSSVVVIDLNQDQFLDICFSNPVRSRAITCYKNIDGKSFTDISDSLNLNLDFEYLPSALYSADFNRDGLADLLAVTYGEHQVFLRKKNGGFVRVKNDWFSNAWGANVFDFNSDGLPDIVFANYYSSVDLNSNEIPWYYSGVSDYKKGDYNKIWLNVGNGIFKESQLKESPHKEHTTAIGLADYDRDGNVNIFESNDYSNDRMYSFSVDKNKYVEQTRRVIPVKHHGFSGMNSEFFDINNDGYLDLFVSNIVLPPLQGLTNLMWVWEPKKRIFEEQARDRGVDRCGYAWTGKAVDLNLDGLEDLVVASGFYTSQTAKLSTFFIQLIKSNTPLWLNASDPNYNIDDYSHGLNSRPCVFIKNNNGKFNDVSDSVLNWDTRKASRTLVVFDINNDGKSDLIIPEQNGFVNIYLNETSHNNNWVGIIFKDKLNQITHFGVHAQIENENGERLLYFELNPANGFKSQSDPRKIIGLGQYNGEVFLKLYNSKNIELKKEKLSKNEYNEIKID